MNNTSTVKNTKKLVENKYKSARGNLLLMIILTALNLVLFYVGSSSMMLFSATVPYYAAAFGYYTYYTPFVIAGAVIAVISILLYLMCWFFSKKHYGWMISALVLFSIDSMCLAYLYIAVFRDVSGILDALIHAFVLYYLVVGVINGKKLRGFPEQDDAVPYENGDTEEASDENSVCDSTALRVAEDEKCRVFLECVEFGHEIKYRRVKRVNELVVDGNVYSDVEMLIELPHELNARIDGHEIAVGIRANSMMYISVDGSIVKEKFRLI